MLSTQGWTGGLGVAGAAASEDSSRAHGDIPTSIQAQDAQEENYLRQLLLRADDLPDGFTEVDELIRYVYTAGTLSVSRTFDGPALPEAPRRGPVRLVSSVTRYPDAEAAGQALANPRGSLNVAGSGEEVPAPSLGEGSRAFRRPLWPREEIALVAKTGNLLFGVSLLMPDAPATVDLLLPYAQAAEGRVQEGLAAVPGRRGDSASQDDEIGTTPDRVPGFATLPFGSPSGTNESAAGGTGLLSSTEARLAAASLTEADVPHDLRLVPRGSGPWSIPTAPGYITTFMRDDARDLDRARLLPAGTVVAVFATLQAPNTDPGLDAVAAGVQSRMERTPSLTALTPVDTAPVGDESRAYTMQLATGTVIAGRPGWRDGRLALLDAQGGAPLASIAYVLFRRGGMYGSLTSVAMGSVPPLEATVQLAQVLDARLIGASPE
ncbi:MAG TPA: hypothetical protein VK066_25945 [Chloroflexota bacterium]|nr:hypothetical protein [Chloroflexota bacterium]